MAVEVTGPPRPADGVPLPGTVRVLTEFRQALVLIGTDPGACRLLSGGRQPELADFLYARWWTVPTSVPAAGRGVRSPVPRPGVLDRARREATGRSDWLVLATPTSGPVAAPLRGGPPRPVALDRIVRTSRPGRPPAPGDLATLVDGTSHHDPSGWWWAHSSDPATAPDGPVDRWYVHAAGLAHAAALLRVLLPLLSDHAIAYSLKTGPAEDRFDRADAMVLYTRRESHDVLRAALVRAAPRIAPHVRPDPPPTTAHVLPGVGTAQDPGGGRSFGQVRCEQTARLAAHPGDLDGDDALTAALAGVGVDVQRPGEVTSWT